MQTQLFAIYDTKAKIYNKPWHETNVDTALRSFAAVVNDPSSVINQNPEDYSFFALGSYDDETAKFDLLDSPNHIANAIELVQHME